MDAITQLIIGDLTEFNELTVLIVICRLIVFGISLETFGVICGHFASLGRR